MHYTSETDMEQELSLTQSSEAIETEEAFTRAGGWGRFQTFLIITMIASMNSQGLLTYALIFFQLDPQYECKFSSNPHVLSECDYDQICSTDASDPVIAWQVNYDSELTLNNWILQFDLFCTPRLYIGFLGSIAFVGAALGCFFMPTMGDRYGRWTVIQVTNFGMIPVFLCCIFAKDLVLIYFMLFWAGVASIGRFSCGFLLLSELVPEKRSAMVGPVLLSGDVAALLWLCFYFRFISKDVIPVYYICLFLNVLCMVFFFLWIPESVRWLVSMRQYDKAKQAIAKIAKFNGKTGFEISSFKQEHDWKMGLEDSAPQESTQADQQLKNTVVSDNSINDSQRNVQEVEQQETQKDQQTGVKKEQGLCSDKMIVWNLCMMIVLWSVSSCDYYLISFFMKYIPGNIFVNTSVSTISEIVATMTASLVYEFFGAKVAFCGSFLTAAIGGLLIAFTSAENTYLIAFFVLLAKFGIAFVFSMVYILTPQLFPTKLTATAFGICNVVARFATILSPILAELKGVIPMLFYSCTALGGLVCSLMLQTKVKYE